MEQEARENLASEAEYLRNLLMSINSQVERLARAMEEVSSTLNVLKDRESIISNDSRITIGSGIYMRVKVEEMNNLLVPIGSDLFKTDSAENVQKSLESNMEDLKASLATLEARRKEAETRYETILTVLQRSPQPGN